MLAHMRDTQPDRQPPLSPTPSSDAQSPTGGPRHRGLGLQRHGRVVPAALLIGALGCAREAPTQPRPRPAEATSVAGSVAANVAPLAAASLCRGELDDAAWADSLRQADGSRFAAVALGTPGRIAFDAGRWPEAVQGLAAWRAEHADHPDACLAYWMELVARWRAGDAAAAASALDVEASAAATHDPAKPGSKVQRLLLAEFSLWAAEAWLDAGDAERAAASLARVAATGPHRTSRAMIAARIAAKGDDAKAALRAWQHAVEIQAGKGASFLLEAVDVALRAEDTAQAAAWLKRVRIEHPGGRSDRNAEAALAKLPEPLRALTPEQRLERVDRARGLYQHELVIQEADALRAASAKGSDLWCAATDHRARATEIFWLRRKEAAAMFDEAVDACKSWSDYGKLLYRAGQRHASSADRNRAIELFARLETLDPKASIVDDAMRWRARSLAEAGRTKDATALLHKIVAFGGDMAEYAAWDLMLERIKAGQWKQLVAEAPALVQAIDHEEKDYNRGRLRYWQARAAEQTGDKAGAIDGYADVLRRSPYAWYGWLAATRLQALDAKRLKAVRATIQAAPAPPAAALPAQVLQDPNLRAGLTLQRMGMTRSARDELDAVHWPKGQGAALLRARLLAATGDVKGAMMAASHLDGLDQPPRGEAQVAWTLAYPMPPAYAPLIASAVAGKAVDPAFVWAIMRTESRFDPRVESPVHATGLLQLMMPTAKAMNGHLKVRETIDAEALRDPAVNIPLGAGYMVRLHGQLGGHMALVASAYNAGPGNTGKWLRERGTWPLDAFVEAIPFKENRRYVKSVGTSWMRYQLLSGRDPAPLALALGKPKTLRKDEAF